MITKEQAKIPGESVQQPCQLMVIANGSDPRVHELVIPC